MLIYPLPIPSEAKNRYNSKKIFMPMQTFSFFHPSIKQKTKMFSIETAEEII